MKKEYYELLEKSELAGIIVALQKLTTQQADRINDLERIERKLREQIEEMETRSRYYGWGVTGLR
jgi:hypothetical protein